MDLSILDTKSALDYSLEADIEKKVVFHLAPFNTSLKLHIEKEIKQELKKEGLKLSDFKDVSDDVTPIYLAYIYMIYLKYGLKGWTGMKDSAGNVVEFKTEEINIPFIGKVKVATQEMLDGLKPEWLGELGRQILLLNQVTKEEEKN